jgi:hypothetical protein
MKARPPSHPFEIPTHYQIRWAHEAGLSDLVNAVEWTKTDSIDIQKNNCKSFAARPIFDGQLPRSVSASYFLLYDIFSRDDENENPQPSRCI